MYFKITTLKFIEQGQLCVKFQRIILINLPGPCKAPIENIWDELERRIRKRIPLPKNETELFNLLQEEWSNIDESVYKNLVESMERRVQAVVKAKGHPTRY